LRTGSCHTRPICRACRVSRHSVDARCAANHGLIAPRFTPASTGAPCENTCRLAVSGEAAIAAARRSRPGLRNNRSRHVRRGGRFGRNQLQVAAQELLWWTASPSSPCVPGQSNADYGRGSCHLAMCVLRARASGLSSTTRRRPSLPRSSLELARMPPLTDAPSAMRCVRRLPIAAASAAGTWTTLVGS
jgi:hypothetical protein